MLQFHHSRIETRFILLVSFDEWLISYFLHLQEIGRAGRNGQQSYCHTFLPPGFSSQSVNANEGGASVITPEEVREANELRRHIFANHVDTVQLKRLLNLIAGKRRRVVALDPDQIAEELDIKPESLATLIIYMHLRTDMQPLLSTLPSWPAVSLSRISLISSWIIAWYLCSCLNSVSEPVWQVRFI